MDWKKTKTILIVAFLGLNIFLSYKIWFDFGPQAFSPWIVPEKEKEVLAHLEEKNISYDGEIPGEVESKGFYEVQNKNVTEEELFENLSLDPGDFERYEQDNVVYYLGPQGKSIYIYNSGMVKLNFPGGYVPGKIFAEDYYNKGLYNTAHWGKEFVDSIFTPDDIYLDDIHINENDKLELIYHQRVGDKDFYGGYMRLVLSRNGVERGQFFWLNFEGESETTIEIIPATTALLRLSNHITTGDKNVIADLSFGYYTQEFFAENWEAVPVWRFRLDSGESYYINAFTGELEGSKKAFEY